MELLVGLLLLAGILSIFDAIRKLNKNIITQIDQNERMIELLNDLKKKGTY
ncbi:hypothetical protein [Brevibacillus sp. NRS-1366]|uniref:hypothetical protein n=1 Tax=Brevibacillus sp. NRS-1366 TaxID=3233899 RepID=UPI003D1F4331